MVGERETDMPFVPHCSVISFPGPALISQLLFLLALICSIKLFQIFHLTFSNWWKLGNVTMNFSYTFTCKLLHVLYIYKCSKVCLELLFIFQRCQPYNKYSSFAWSVRGKYQPTWSWRWWRSCFLALSLKDLYIKKHLIFSSNTYYHN